MSLKSLCAQKNEGKREDEATDETTLEAIKLATSELEQTANAFRSAFTSQPQSQAPGAETPKGPNDDAIDAEFEVKN